MDAETLKSFVANYGPNETVRQIVVSDRNAEFRAQVASFVAENPHEAPRNLIRDLILQEAIWGRSGDVTVGTLLQLMSYLLNAGGARELETVVLATGHNMDLDCAMQARGLRLTSAVRDDLCRALTKMKVNASDPRWQVAHQAIHSATLVGRSDG